MDLALLIRTHSWLKELSFSTVSIVCVCVFVCVLIFQFQMNMSVVSQIFSQIKSWNNYIKNVKLCFTGFYFMSWFTYIPTYFKNSYGEYTSYVMAMISVFIAM